MHVFCRIGNLVDVIWFVLLLAVSASLFSLSLYLFICFFFSVSLLISNCISFRVRCFFLDVCWVMRYKRQITQQTKFNESMKILHQLRSLFVRQIDTWHWDANEEKCHIQFDWTDDYNNANIWHRSMMTNERTAIGKTHDLIRHFRSFVILFHWNVCTQ